MPTIRDLVEGRDLQFASPLAEHVSKHTSDPVGATKDTFNKLSKAKMEYDLARQEAARNLAPVQTVIDHVSQLHGLKPGMPTPNADFGQPQPDDGTEMQDEMGNVIPPGQRTQPGGNLAVNRPSQVGHQPGVAPMSEKQVVPPKLGMASPGNPNARNSPAPKGSNPQSAQFNPAAKSPKGNRSLPGAKGPGDAKVANRTKKAQQTTGQDNSVPRPVKVTVHAARSFPQGTTINDAELRSYADLKTRRVKAATMPLAPGGALGPSSVMPSSNPATGKSLKAKTYRTPHRTHLPGTKDLNAKGKPFPGVRKVKALDQLSDKMPGDTQHQVAFNPKFEASKTIDVCAKCGGMHAANGKCMKAGGPGSGRRPGSGKSIDKYAQAAKLARDPNYWKGKQTVQFSDYTQKEGGPGHSGMISMLHDAGIPARKYSPGSPYEGHVAVETLAKHEGRANKVLFGNMEAAGHSRGAKKGWSTRGKGHLSKVEKKAHYAKMDQVDAVAPPGREDQVKALKPKVGTKSAFKIAWSSFNKGKRSA